MFTNYPYPQYRKKCQEVGADFFFDKSTEFHKITGVLEKISRESPRRSTRNSIKRKKQKHNFPALNIDKTLKTRHKDPS